MVEHVVEVRANDEFLAFAPQVDARALGNAEVGVEIAGSAELVSLLVAEARGS